MASRNIKTIAIIPFSITPLEVLEWTTRARQQLSIEGLAGVQELSAVVDSSSVAVARNLLFFVQNKSLLSDFAEEIVTTIRDSAIKTYGMGLSLESTGFEQLVNQDVTSVDGVTQLTSSFVKQLQI